MVVGAVTLTVASERWWARDAWLAAFGRCGAPRPMEVSDPSRTVLPMTIYLDHNATTPLDRRVLEAMLPYLGDRYGNPASTHGPGRAAKHAVDIASERLAALLGVSASAVVWTSGATESLNTILKGLTNREPRNRPRLVYGASEHKAVLDSVQQIGAASGFEVAAAPVTASGPVDLDALEELVDERTVAVCVMAANNESGAVSNLPQLSQIARAAGALVVCDATQQAGKLPVDLGAHVDFAAVSAHKLYGPKGVGALIATRPWARKELTPLIHGGGHQGGLRSGTLNVPGIVGLGKAAELAASEMPEEAERVDRLRGRLEQLLEKQAGPLTIHSREAPRLPNTTNVRLHGVDADALIVNCPDVAFSSGSACTSSVPTPSHVLSAMGVATDEAEESIRLSLGRFTTEAEVDQAAELIGAAAARIREVNS